MEIQPIAVSQSLAYVLNSAGDKSGVDFDYLLQTAMRESSLNPTAKATTSSAVGLFQFLDSTWLEVMKEEGPRLGYQKYAKAITETADGDFVIKDKALRAEVLKLRENPQVAADMAAAFTRSNGAYLQDKFGRMPSAGELYIAHFLGARGAEKMFNAGLANADQIAAKLFPRQAKANPQIFYADGQARTIRDVYRALVAKHDATSAGAAPGFVTQQIASTPNGKWPEDAVPSRFGPADMSFTGLFSTEAASGPRPLVPLQQPASSAPLTAIDAALSAVQFAKAFNTSLPVPEPLIPGLEPLALMPDAPQPPAADTSIPKPRVLMTNDPAGGADSVFLTQLLGRPER